MGKCWRASFLFAQLLFGAIAFAQSHTVTLSWTPAQQPSGITIASWNVLRGTTSGGPYTQLANVAVSTTTYVDNAVSSGADYYYVVQAVDTEGVSSADSTQVEAVIPTSAPPLAVATSNLPSATAGTSYSTTITASGGTGPYTWSGMGVDGLTFSNTGLLSGTPSAGGSFTQSVTVQDSAGNTASASLPLSVSAALAIATTSLPAATAGASYSTTITASGGTGPYTWSGMGVDGLTFSSTGLLSGRPSSDGSFTQSVTVQDSAGNTASASLPLNVLAVLAITTTSLPAATAGASYSTTITARGGAAPYTWSGTGVDGLTFSASGVLSGQPSTVGSFTQNVTVQDSTGNVASSSLSLSVIAMSQPLAITTSSLAAGTAGTIYSATLTASGGVSPYTWSGSGVDGLTFSATGVLSGTPSAAGSFTQSVTVSDSAGNTTSASLPLSIAPAAIGSSPAFVQVNSAVPQGQNAQVSVPFIASQTAGDLNVVVVGWHDSTAQISSVTDSMGNSYASAVGPTVQTGTATQAIYYAKNIFAAAAGSNTVNVVFNTGANSPDVRIAEYSGVDLTSPLDVVAAAQGTGTLSSSGSVTTTNATDLLVAANLVHWSTTGPGSGYTPRVITNPDSDILEDEIVSTIGSYSATAQLNGGAWIMQMVAFRAAGSGTGAAPVITSVTSMTLVAGNAGSFTVTATGSPVPALTESGALPTGVTFTDNGNGTATLGGTPALGTHGTYPLTFSASNGVGTPATQNFTLTVEQSPSFTSADNTTFTVGATGTFSITTTGLPTPSLTESGTLPLGMIFTDNGDGTATLSGTPASGTAGEYSLTLTASNGMGTPGSQSFTLAVVSGSGSSSLLFVQVNSADPPGQNSQVSVTYAAAQTARDLNVVVVGWHDSIAQISSVTDSMGNTYHLAVGPTVQTGLATQSIYYATNIPTAPAAGNTVTVIFNTGATSADIRIAEYSGVDSDNPIDVVAAAEGSGTVSNSRYVTTTNADDLLVGANLVQQSTIGPGGTYTNRVITSPDGNILEDRIAIVAGSYRATAQISGGAWIMQMVAFRAAAP